MEILRTRNYSIGMRFLRAVTSPRLTDHQPFQLANVNSHEPTVVINNTIGLAMTAKAYGIPTILATVTEERGGQIFKGIQEK